jgi:hypothetical protein
MAKLKKYPKKPGAKATSRQLENYLAKCKEIDKQNAPVKAEMKKRETLKAQVAKIGRSK